jgi:hypothetical protein
MAETATVDGCCDDAFQSVVDSQLLLAAAALEA